MKQLLILSGKGGTGKTTVASAFIKLAKAKAYADCDVDAPNLHLAIHHPQKPKNTEFFGMKKANIDNAICTRCGLCETHCRFDAITSVDGYKVDEYACEGCGVCRMVCPENAISLVPHVAGNLILYKSDTVFSTALLKMGSGNSGMLVSKVKKQLIEANVDSDIVIIDGSPGIGCPVIASITGVDMVLIVTEPTISGISDLKRIVKTAEIFQVKVAVCINKYDINLENTKQIEVLCDALKLPLTTGIPYDIMAVQAVNEGMTIVDVACASGSAVRKVMSETMTILNG